MDKFGAKSSKLQLEGVVTDMANVNKFIKKYDKSIYDIVGGPFQYDVKLSSGSIMDCYATAKIVESRIKQIFSESMVDADRGITNTVLLYFSGHGS